MDSLRDKDGFIDVKKLIATYSVEEHKARADAYFSRFSEKSQVLRKPFQGVGEAVAILQGLSIVLRGLKLFPGARVVDFGAGTAWLSKFLAYLECDVTAVDLSRCALELGRKVNENDNFADDLKISYLPYDGTTIPLPDSDVERICCFDAFHHVADQKATLQEFYRVMKPGAIAAFHEPGPEHSRSVDAQYEMENFHVIENDIYIEEIARMAKEIGFNDLKLAWYTPMPLFLDVDTFNTVISGDAPRSQEKALVTQTGQALRNMRIFFLSKPYDEVLDSRRGEGLKARLEVSVLRRQGRDLTGTVTVENAGTAVWLPSGPDLGSVQVGVQLRGSAEAAGIRDHARILISDVPIRPGERKTVNFSVRLPDSPDDDLVFDLVSERVVWFAQVGGCRPVTIKVRDLRA